MLAFSMDTTNFFDLAVDHFSHPPRANLSSLGGPTVVDVSQLLDMDCFFDESEIDRIDNPHSFYLGSPFAMLSPGEMWQELIPCAAHYISDDEPVEAGANDLFIYTEQQLKPISPHESRQVPLVSLNSDIGHLSSDENKALDDEVHIDIEGLSYNVCSPPSNEVAATTSMSSPIMMQAPQVWSQAREQAQTSSKKRSRWQDDDEEGEERMPDYACDEGKLAERGLAAIILDTSKKVKMSPHSVLEESYQAEEEGPEMRVAGRRCEETRRKANGSGRLWAKGRERGREARWAEQLLGACAAAIASNNLVRTQHLMWVLNDLASLSGDANQRLAAYGLRALFARITATSPPPLRLSASALRSHIRFHHVSPWHHLPHSIANFALLDALEGRSCLHIIDIGISHSTQWPTLIEALATRPSPTPSLLRLTTVTDPRHIFDSIPFSSSSEFQRRLRPFANSLGLRLQLHNVSVALEDLTPKDLDLQDGEALAICCQFRLHQVSDVPFIASNTATRKSPRDCDTLEFLSPRDAVLQRLHGMNPVVLVLSENDTDHSSDEFLTRFQEVLNFNWKFLDSTAVSFRGRDCEERRVIEAEAAMATVLNSVACEGEARVERNQVRGAWNEQMSRAGFRPMQLKNPVLENARALLRKYDDDWEMVEEEEGSSISLQWKGEPTTFSSIWKPTEKAEI